MVRWSYQYMDKQIKDLLAPVSRENLNEKIVSQIKALIFSKEIDIGQRLPSERDLALQFKAGRAVVREALKSLEQSGLVEIRTGGTGGAFVAFNLHIPLFRATYDLFNAGQLTLSHFYEARKAIECSTVRLAAQKATAEDIERLRSMNSALADDQTDPSKLGEMNMAFHIAVAEIAGNPLMKLIVSSVIALLGALYTGWEEVRTREFMKRMYKRHEAIIQAMEARDLSRCEELMILDTEYTQRLELGKAGLAAADTEPNRADMQPPDEE
jgi:GntR family transcriptional regulator, transcriptional repressor for pyruvate dehydrogenase complex